MSLKNAGRRRRRRRRRRRGSIRRVYYGVTMLSQ